MGVTPSSAGSLAVLLRWLYFSAAVLLGAEFLAARARLHDPRGAWGIQSGRVPPGSRAKIGSMLAGVDADRDALAGGGTSTVAPNSPASARQTAAAVATTQRAASDARRSIGAQAQHTQQLTGQARKKVSAMSKALEISAQDRPRRSGGDTHHGESDDRRRP